MLIDVLTTVSTPVAPSTALSPGPDWWGALNGLHPLVIHFPIALVITAAVVEFIAMLARQERPTQFTVISLVVAAFASALAAWSGWGLADEGYGGGWMLSLHRWLGVVTAGVIIILAVCSVIAWYGPKAWATATVRAGILVAAALVAVTAHFGGEMVWGGSLVMEALFPESPAADPPKATVPNPDAVPAVQDESVPAVGTSTKTLDFQTMVAPILDKHCWKCHGPADRGKRAKAGIRLSNQKELLDDHDGLVMIKPGDPEGSLLFHVVTLPRDDEDAMPPRKEGAGLSEQEVGTLREWIKAGAPFVATTGETATPSVVPAAPVTEATETDAAIEPVLQKLKARGVPARPISQDSPDLEFNANGLSHRITPPFSNEDLAMLDGLQARLVEIDLSSTAVTDAGVARLAGFDALRVVKLKDTRTGDAAATVLAGLPAIEVVNFYGSDLQNAGLLALAKSTSIKTIYAGETAVTAAGVAAALAAHPELVVHHQLPSTALPSTEAPVESSTGTLDPTIFKTSIEPILKKNCWSCHGPGGKPKADLTLVTVDDLLATRGNERLVDPGKPEDSLILQRINMPRGERGAMPPRGPGLSEEQITRIRDWILAAKKS